MTHITPARNSETPSNSRDRKLEKIGERAMLGAFVAADLATLGFTMTGSNQDLGIANQISTGVGLGILPGLIAAVGTGFVGVVAIEGYRYAAKLITSHNQKTSEHSSLRPQRGPTLQDPTTKKQHIPT